MPTRDEIRRNSLSLLQYAGEKDRVVERGQNRRFEMSDAMRSVWRGWTEEVERIGGKGCMGGDNWKMPMGKTEKILMAILLVLALILLMMAYMTIFING